MSPKTLLGFPAVRWKPLHWDHNQTLTIHRQAIVQVAHDERISKKPAIGPFVEQRWPVENAVSDLAVAPGQCDRQKGLPKPLAKSSTQPMQKAKKKPTP